jgi:tRNA/rRNA methyltransferase
LPEESQPAPLQIVLVSPRNPLNIGAAARAMANFGFTHLTVVAPYAPHWQEARSAVGASDLLQNAKVTESLAGAVADCTLVVGTGTLTHRKPEQPVVALPDLPSRLSPEIERGGRVALVFGPEKHGLTREDLSCCHLLVEIPTHPRQPSMNLGQAVAVCLYQLAARLTAPARDNTQPHPSSSRPAALTAPSADLDLLSGVIEKVMLAARYSPTSMQGANRHDLRLFLRRLALTRRDARRVLGFFRRVLHRLERRPE